MRSILLPLAFCLSILMAHAQSVVQHHFRAPSELDRAGHKAVWAVLLPLDEKVQVSISEDRVKLRSDQSLSVDVLRAALDATGLGPFSWELPPTPVVDRAVFNDFPQLVDTGDPAHDEQVLAAAKAAWLSTHTGALELYLHLVEQGEDPGVHAGSTE